MRHSPGRYDVLNAESVAQCFVETVLFLMFQRRLALRLRISLNLQVRPHGLRSCYRHFQGSQSLYDIAKYRDIISDMAIFDWHRLRRMMYWHAPWCNIYASLTVLRRLQTPNRILI